MFFDIILLNPQHRGQFGKAWIAGTRGIRYISKADLKSMDLCKLCDHIMKYMVTNTTSPQKRFSLRLTCILLNGAIRIFREQAILLNAEICTVLQTIRIPAGARGISESDAKEIFGSPLTPIAKIRNKKPRKQKPVVVETPPVLSEELLPFKDLSIDIVHLQPTSDLITLRELAPKPLEHPEDDGFGVATDVELLLKTLPAQPTSSSSSAGGPVIIQVEAQVHTQKDDLEKLPQPMETEVLAGEKPQITESITVSDVSRVLQEIQLSKHVEKKVQNAKERRFPDIAIRTDDVENIQIIDTAEKDTAIQIIPVSPVLQEIQATEKSVIKERDALVNKDLPKSENLYFGRQIRRFIGINRCDDKGGRFHNKSCLPESSFQNRHHTYVYNYYSVTDSGIDPIVEIRTGSQSLGSSIDSFGKLRPGSHKRSTLETDAVREARSSQGLTGTPEVIGLTTARSIDVPMEIEIHEETTLPTLQDVAVPSLEIPKIATPRQMRKSVSHVEETVPGIEQLVEKTPSIEEPFEPLISPTPSIINVQRRQKVLNVLMKWNFDQGFPTILDIADMPFSPLSISRAFYDLLVLSASKHVVLISEDDSIELKFIKKGPKLEN